MTQPDLFEQPQKFTRSGSSIVPPTREELARRKRDRGMARAAEHADTQCPDWQERALGYVRLYAVVHETFLAEDVRAEAEKDGLPPPPTKRAWGPVMQLAAKEGIVKAIGTGKANSSNGSFKVKWGRA